MMPRFNICADLGGVHRVCNALNEAYRAQFPYRFMFLPEKDITAYELAWITLGFGGTLPKFCTVIPSQRSPDEMRETPGGRHFLPLSEDTPFELPFGAGLPKERPATGLDPTWPDPDASEEWR